MTRVEDLHGAEHVERYLATDGREGHDWRRGAPVLLLTTTGRRSGEARTTPLIYQPHGDAYAVVASKGGSDRPPAWYRNLEARARTATPDEKPELWAKMTSVWPDYDDYQRRTEREIPVVVLERTN